MYHVSSGATVRSRSERCSTTAECRRLQAICSAMIGLDSGNQLLSAKWFVDPVRAAQVVSLAAMEHPN